jgi:hypothetical protein
MRLRETPEHEADHGKAHERRSLAGMALIVTGQPPVPADPGHGSLHDPSFREHDEAVAVAAAHDLKRPRAGPSDGGFHPAALIARITDDPLDEGEGSPRLAQQGLCAVPILNARRMNDDREEEPKGVGQDMALAANDLLARIIAGRVERSPPLRAPLAVWLSMMAVVGLASRPAASRASTYRA